MTISLDYVPTVVTQIILIMSFLTLRPITYIDKTCEPLCLIELQTTRSTEDISKIFFSYLNENIRCDPHLNCINEGYY